MTENKTLLIIRLEGVLQSWGENSKWDFRDSSTMPTKSGVVGLLGCALGVERDSPELAELVQSITIAVRADRPGVKFVDYQTVMGNPLKTALGKPRKIDGKPANTIISSRAYLQDACFTVFIETTDDWRERIVKALRDPKWCIYLGRKNCVPSRPVFESITDEYATLLEAVERYPASERANHPMTYECEENDATSASLLRSDNLAGIGRQFSLRRVWRGSVMEENHVSD